ncbi:MAG TPA: hypothetical protein VGR89_00635 [Puia sp.]|nr:hypothetical protein [Puia sp.]
MHDTGFRKSLTAGPEAVDVFVGTPGLTVNPKPYHIDLDWSLPSGLQTALQNNGGIASFVIYRCESGSCDCTPVGPPSGVPYATVPGNQFSFADTQVNAGDTYTYMVSYVYFDACSQLNETSPPSSSLCAQTCGSGCSSPEVLITGNEWANNDQGDAPIVTYDLGDGSLVNSFVPQSGTGLSGRGLAIYVTGTVTDLYYTEVSYNSSYGAGDGKIHICSYGIEGSGAQTDSGSLQSPDQGQTPDGGTDGVQDLAFHIDPVTGQNELFVMTGYLNRQPEVYEIDPTSGSKVLNGSLSSNPIVIAGPAAEDSDGFAVLTNSTDGKLYFLINEGDGSSLYDEYDTEGKCVSGSPPYINLQSYIPNCDSTGVASAPDGKSLYFIANPGISSPTLLQIGWPGLNQMKSQQINNPYSSDDEGIEDIDALILQ